MNNHRENLPYDAFLVDQVRCCAAVPGGLPVIDIAHNVERWGGPESPEYSSVRLEVFVFLSHGDDDCIAPNKLIVHLLQLNQLR